MPATRRVKAVKQCKVRETLQQTKKGDFQQHLRQGRKKELQEKVLEIDQWATLVQAFPIEENSSVPQLFESKIGFKVIQVASVGKNSLPSHQVLGTKTDSTPATKDSIEKNNLPPQFHETKTSSTLVNERPVEGLSPTPQADSLPQANKPSQAVNTPSQALSSTRFTTPPKTHSTESSELECPGAPRKREIIDRDVRVPRYQRSTMGLWLATKQEGKSLDRPFEDIDYTPTRPAKRIKKT